ncbi:MAG: hypothetical protein IPK91_06000 [Saprospiraceae bacterium]|nr:hypothetical protein [Saprospiraceae bacterium]MBK8296823.1 hypothetical protein [Saprospiraceae bacterium]
MRKCKNCSYKLMEYDPDQCPQCGSKDILKDTSTFNTVKGEQDQIEQKHTKMGRQFDDLEPINMTVKGKQMDNPNSPGQAPNQCPHCGYPLIIISSVCQNCNKSIAQAKQDDHQIVNSKTISLKDLIESESNESRPFMELIPLNKGEGPIKIKLKDGGERVLGRIEIDPQDESLSQNQHVKFSFKEKNWTLDNVASNQAVFKMVRTEEKLQDGDIIMIGRNKFYQVKL